MAAITATAVAKAAAALLSNEKTRKGIGWILVAIFSPIIIALVLVMAFMQAGEKHNADAIQLCFFGGAPPNHSSLEYLAYINDMRDSFGLLDDAIDAVNEQAEEEKLDTIRVKSVFYALYFGMESPSRRDHAKFVDCFVTYEEREREVEVPNPDYDASDSSNSEPETITVTETYTVMVPIKSQAVVYQNIASKLGIVATLEQKTNAQEIYYRVAHDNMAPEGTELDDWLLGLADPNKPFPVLDGFNSPVGPDWRSMVSSEFSWREDPITGEWDLHRGIDLSNGEGYPIVAALDGTVIYVRTGSGSSYGMHLAIDHGGGFITLYAHCSSIVVYEGEEVKGGQLIAGMGSTGRVTGTHVHFEVQVGGVLHNPREYLP